MEDVIIIRCPKCNSSQTYYRLKDNSHRCKVCNFIWENEKISEGEE